MRLKRGDDIIEYFTTIKGTVIYKVIYCKDSSEYYTGGMVNLILNIDMLNKEEYYVWDSGSSWEPCNLMETE